MGMLIKVKMKCTMREEGDRQVTDYYPCLLQTDNVDSFLPSGIDGVLTVMMMNKATHLIKGEMDDFDEGKPDVEVVAP
jgi:hypothetical protein